MNINFELYRVFYTVANTSNITKAANELSISQPAISKSIKNLEQQLGGKLFIRTKRGVTLTEEGKQFYYYIKQAMDYINSAEHKFSDLMNLETGTIKIGISTTLTKEFLLPYLKEFHIMHPNINIEIDTSMAKDSLIKLRNGLLDLVILNLNDEEKISDINITKCRKLQDIFITSDKYKELLNREVSLSELDNYPLILQPKISNTRKFLDDALNNYNISLKPNIELASYTLVTEFTKIGLGVGYATREYIKSSLDTKELFEINIKESIPKRYIALATSKNTLPSFSTKKLIELINTNN